jgi:hypothetical protein
MRSWAIQAHSRILKKKDRQKDRQTSKYIMVFTPRGLWFG